MSKYLQEMGIRGVSIHSLRNIFGAHTVKRGTKLRMVQEMLGPPQTTLLYVQFAREDMDRQILENCWNIS